MRPRLLSLSLSVFCAGMVLGGTTSSTAATPVPVPTPAAAPSWDATLPPAGAVPFAPGTVLTER